MARLRAAERVYRTVPSTSDKQRARYEPCWVESTPEARELDQLCDAQTGASPKCPVCRVQKTP